MNGFVIAQRRKRFGHSSGCKCITLADVYRRCSMRETECDERHLTAGQRYEQTLNRIVRCRYRVVDFGSRMRG